MFLINFYNFLMCFFSKYIETQNCEVDGLFVKIEVDINLVICREYYRLMTITFAHW